MKMPRLSCTVWAAVLLPVAIAAQVETETGTAPEPPVRFQVDAISFASADSNLSRLDVFLQLTYDNLSFVKQDETYTASYEAQITLLDSAGRVAKEKLWTEEVRAASFNESVSPQAYSLTQRVFDIPPGRYSIVTVVRDLETRISQKLVRGIEVQRYGIAPFTLSDLMLVRRLTVVGEKRSIIPNVSSNIGALREGLVLFFEAYNAAGIDSVRLHVAVLNDKKELRLALDTLQPLLPGRNQVFVRVDHSTLTLGDYTLYVQAFRLKAAEGDHPLATTSRSIEVRWRGLPTTVGDLDVAVDQLQYIAKEEEIDHIKEAAGVEEKQKRFLEFWKSKDPNPNTPRNEKMEDYYARVEYANKHFRHYLEGWKTDMGMVYIRFGPPSAVDRHPFDIDAKPYEVWAYYDLNYQFVFVDQSGFGDYRLITPIWEVWQRAKD